MLLLPLAAFITTRILKQPVLWTDDTPVMFFDRNGKPVQTKKGELHAKCVGLLVAGCQVPSGTPAHAAQSSAKAFARLTGLNQRLSVDCNAGARPTRLLGRPSLAAAFAVPPTSFAPRLL